MGLVAPTLVTERLRLRPWRASDRGPWAALNADPVVMEHMPALLSREEADALADRIEAQMAEQGWGLWAVEVPGVVDFAGFTGLMHARFEAPFNPSIEVGWRLAKEVWGHGYATEGARAALAFAWDVLGLDEVTSFTAVTNVRSQRVMEKLGMTCDRAEDFDHPALPSGHPLERHVLHRIRRPG